MSKELIKRIIIAILSILTGYQAGNPNSMARAFLFPDPPQAYGNAEKGKTEAMADLLWAKIQSDTIQVGNFAPVVLTDTAYIVTARQVIQAEADPRKLRTWQKSTTPPAWGYKLTRILKLYE